MKGITSLSITTIDQSNKHQAYGADGFLGLQKVKTLDLHRLNLDTIQDILLPRQFPGLEKLILNDATGHLREICFELPMISELTLFAFESLKDVDASGTDLSLTGGVANVEEKTRKIKIIGKGPSHLER